MKTTEKIRSVLLILVLGLGLHLAAQTPAPIPGSSTYKNAIGLRVGGTSGLTYKHIFPGGSAFEGILSTWPYSVGITGLYEKYNATNTEGLNFYYGGGGHINVGSPYSQVYYYRYYNNRRYDYVYTYGGGSAGIDGILGIEYKFKPIPFAISGDIKPFAELSSNGQVYMAIDPSIGVKIAF